MRRRRTWKTRKRWMNRKWRGREKGGGRVSDVERGGRAGNVKN